MISKEDLGIELFAFSQRDSEMTLLQIYNVNTNGMNLAENLESFTIRDQFQMEVEIPPNNLVTKVFKVDLKKKIYMDDCNKFYFLSISYTFLCSEK